jgi:hypothetical protein
MIATNTTRAIVSVKVASFALIGADFRQVASISST